jgi:hypothetical protein
MRLHRAARVETKSDKLFLPKVSPRLPRGPQVLEWASSGLHSDVTGSCPRAHAATIAQHVKSDETPDRTPVTRDSIIFRVMLARPDSERVLFEEFKLPCYTCEVSYTESVGDGARIYGLDPDLVVARLNQCPLAPEDVPDPHGPPE